MLLWSVIRDFFVQYLFGGIDSTGTLYQGLMGTFADSNDFMYYELGTNTFYVPINGWTDYADLPVNFISFGDWLSTTATIITLVGLFIAITLLIISLFKWIVRLVSLRG